MNSAVLFYEAERNLRGGVAKSRSSTDSASVALLLNQEKRISVHLLIALSEDLNGKAGSSYR